MEDDEVLDELVDEILVDDLVPVSGDGHEGRSEADGQVVRIHHVLVTEIERVSFIQFYSSQTDKFRVIL